MNRPKRDHRWQSPRDRARVAAELIEEAESLSETCLIATPADVVKATRPAPIHVATDAPSTPPTPPAPTPAAPPPPVPRDTRSEPGREAALAVLDAALQAAPDDAALLLRRARLHSDAGNFGAARRDLERVLAVTAEHGEALTLLGHVLSRRGLWAEAAGHLRRAVAIDVERSEAWYYLGEALNHVDDLAGALAAFIRATELQPTHAKAFHGQGIVLDRLNRPEDATRMYRRAREVARR